MKLKYKALKKVIPSKMKLWKTIAGQQEKKTRDSSRISKKEKGKEIQEENIAKEKTLKIGSQVFSPQITQEDSRFFDIKAVKKYESWIGNGRKILAGNMADPSVFKEGFESILTNFASLGWQNLQTMHEKFFPALVYEFYENFRKVEIMRMRINDMDEE